MNRIANFSRGVIAKAPARTRRPRNEGKDAGYIAWLHTLPCCVSGVTDRIIAHHPTVARGRMGRKEDDATAVPLTEEMRSDQYPDALHKIGERKFWNRCGIDPFALADDLYTFYKLWGAAGLAGRELIRAHRDMGKVRVKLWLMVFEEKE